MSADPARNRFFIIHAVRFAGVAQVILGMVAAAGRLGLPEWAGWVLIANGALDAFVIPQILARRWRTPK
jgi:hypothetical protein